jgi:hypothetical protein
MASALLCIKPWSLRRGNEMHQSSADRFLEIDLHKGRIRGRWCFGKTPMQTFRDAMPKGEDDIGHQNPIAQPDTRLSDRVGALAVDLNVKKFRMPAHPAKECASSTGQPEKSRIARRLLAAASHSGASWACGMRRSKR